MDAEQAWQSALGQLQTEMPKGSFDTWVRDTRVISYANGKFVIGVRNSYTRDWLDSRLSSTANRLLMGMMNQSVDVEFVITETETESDDLVGSQDDLPDKNDELSVEAHYDLAYDEIVIPEHVTVVPRYFLRHLRLIGPDLGWLYLGFRQAAFNAGARSGKKSERFSGTSIAAMSGIAVSTFWNKIREARTWEQLQGLVSTSVGTPEWNLDSPTPRRLPRRYVVAMTLPLTAPDTRSLRTWLLANLERLGGPENVITAAVETPLDELLSPDALAQEGDTPETVPAILRSLFGNLIPSGNLVALATRLHKHIMPDSNRLGMTHFFVEHILPFLGTGPGWMLTLLRERCYTNRETGEVRDQVRIPGGYTEIASLIGVTPGTIKRWLYGKHSVSRGRSKSASKGGQQRGPGRQAAEIGKLTNPVLRIYLQETTSGKVSDIWASPRSFKVLLDEIPVEILEAAEDERVGQALIRALTNEENDYGAASILEAPDSRAVCSIGLARFTIPARFAVSEGSISARFVISESPVSTRFVVSESSISARFVDDQRAVCSIVSARFVDDLCAVCRVFKSLNYLNPITNDSPTTPLPPNSSEKSYRQSIRLGGGMGNQSFWDFDFLMQNNQVAKARDIQKRQKATGASIEALAQGFVSWLLYAYSPSGQRIEDPIALAAKRLLENVHTGAGGDFDRLAHLKPFELKALFDHDLAGDLWEVNETIEKSIYVVNYGHLTGPYKRELYRRLFGGE